MDAPSERCRKCNWWTLLGEIKEEMRETLPKKNLYIKGNLSYPSHQNMLIENIISVFAQAAYKVCREHWEGKR